MFAFIWVQAGFAMVITAAGLASIPRDTLEAARTDGASEWQVFRRITIPLLAPVLTVVFVTQIIGVLKLFDLILSIAPGSTQDEAATLAFVHVAGLVQRPEPLRARRRDRDLHPDPLHPLPDRQHPALPGGHELMATVDTTVETPVDPDTRLSARIVRFLAKTPLHIVLALIAIFWLVPTTGLFITSMLTPSDAAEGHWWTFVTKPSTWTLENYANMFENEGITHALWVTVLVTIGATIVPILVAALAAYALAWIEFPGRDWLFLRSSASCSCRSRWR